MDDIYEDDDLTYDDSYWAELKWEQGQEEWLEECWERTIQLIGECSDYDPLEDRRPLLGHLLKAWEYLKNDMIHDPYNKTLKQIDKNLNTLAKQAQKEMDINYEETEPLYF
jgi:hypothetical protein